MKKNFARINEYGDVIGVIEVPPQEVADGLHGDPSTLIQTADDDWRTLHSAGQPIFRRYRAGAGMIYDRDRDAFYWKKPASGNWIFNETTLLWEAA